MGGLGGCAVGLVEAGRVGGLGKWAVGEGMGNGV